MFFLQSYIAKIVETTLTIGARDDIFHSNGIYPLCIMKI